MDLGIAGKTALVTASSRGLGRAAADALAAEGVRVAINGRDGASLDEARAALEGAGVEVLALPGDVTAPAAPRAMVDAVVERFGGIDIMVANAGGPPPGKALDVDDEAVVSAVNANMLTTVRLVRAAVPHMREGRWGRIVAIASYSVVQPLPNLALSNLARTGLRAWAKTAAADLAAEGSGLTLNLACPGTHATERMVALGGSGGVGPLGDPADFGAVVAFLCSAQAGYVNGATIVVDGGATLAL